MAHVGVKYAAFAVHVRPGRGIVRAFVNFAVHLGRVLNEQHVHVRREILERVPLFHRSEVSRNVAHAGKLFVHANHVPWLLLAVFDEFAADHFDVGIGIVAVVLIAGGTVLFAARRVKCVGGTVDTHKTFSVVDRLKKHGLGFFAHRGIAVGADRGQIAGGVEHEGIELLQILWCEHRAVFGEREFDVVLGAEFLEDLLGSGKFARSVFDGGVFEARRLIEEQNVLGRFVGGENRRGGQDGSNDVRERTKNRACFHRFDKDNGCIGQSKQNVCYS